MYNFLPFPHPSENQYDSCNQELHKWFIFLPDVNVKPMVIGTCAILDTEPESTSAILGGEADPGVFEEESSQVGASSKTCIIFTFPTPKTKISTILAIRNCTSSLFIFCQMLM